jgi:Spy/CpxP family protein refolding chaperone
MIEPEEIAMRYGWTRWLGILAGVTALAAAPAVAQDAVQEKPHHEREHDGERRGHDPEKRIEKLREALSLTDAQVAQVQAIFAEQGEKRRALRESEDHAGLEALHRETHDRLVAVLDETQRARLEEMRVGHEEGHRRGGEKHEDGEGREHREGHGAES